MSVLFEWKQEDMADLLATCETDGIFPLVAKYVPKGSNVLDSGCGPGRYVRYLQDRGWRVIGVEWSHETVKMARRVWPDLAIVRGDAADLPFGDNEFDGVISLGVVEHWWEGPAGPLRAIYRVLKPGGVALITVPCFSRIRQIKHWLWWNEITGLPRALLDRILRGKRMPMSRLNKKYRHAVFPSYGNFFEYRMTPGEFLEEVSSTGFEIIEHLPLAEIDGIYHELNPWKLLVGFRNWKFEVSPLARILNEALSKRRFFHCHLQCVVGQKSAYIS